MVHRRIYPSVGVTESSIMPLYDRTMTETEMSSGWLPWLSLGAALRFAFSVGFSASGDGWGDHPGDISVSLIKLLCIHIYLVVVVLLFPEEYNMIHSIITTFQQFHKCIPLTIAREAQGLIELYTVSWEHNSYCGFMCLFILIIVLINTIFNMCVLHAFISCHCIFCVFIHFCSESRWLATLGANVICFTMYRLWIWFSYSCS